MCLRAEGSEEVCLFVCLFPQSFKAKKNICDNLVGQIMRSIHILKEFQLDM